MYWINPQFSVRLSEPDADFEDGKCTLLISLMQKNSRLLRTYLKKNMANIAMGFDVYKVFEHVGPIVVIIR